MKLIYLVVLSPLFSFLLLSFLNKKNKKSHCFFSSPAFIGIFFSGISFLASVLVAIDFFQNRTVYCFEPIWNWIILNNKEINCGFFLDDVSVRLMLLITVISFLVNFFSNWYMKNKNEHTRFFSYLNLFITGMLLLILANNLVLMYLGWEIVGVCSYLLIGFYHKIFKNSFSANKAFIITKIGDFFFLIAIFMVFQQFKCLDFYNLNFIFKRFSYFYFLNLPFLNWIGFFLLIAAISKSAQVPLHVWLADAMVGPTPVSALMHSATMVTAGVYLIFRTRFLFSYSPFLLYCISIIGILTILVGSLLALVQNNIKKILAYSTISQLGYMFLALGSQAWNLAIFHLISHAIFKSLLFISSGVLIRLCNDEKNIFFMGDRDLYKKYWFLYGCFLAGVFSLVAFPFLTMGFYSKDTILEFLWMKDQVSLFVIGIIGSLITCFYSYRMIFLIFHKRFKKKNFFKLIPSEHNFFYQFPLVVLFLLTTVIGDFFLFSDREFFFSFFVTKNVHRLMLIISFFVSLIGFLIPFLLWKRNCRIYFFIKKSKIINFFYGLLINSFYFNHIYDFFIKNFYLRIVSILKDDVFVLFLDQSYIFLNFLNRSLLLLSNGFLRWYFSSIAFGLVLIIFFYLLF